MSDIRVGTDGRIPGNGAIVERRVELSDATLSLRVKEPLPGRVLVSAQDEGRVRTGAVLFYDKSREHFIVVNDGLYPAIRLVTKHVPEGYVDEEAQIRAWSGTLAWAYSVFVDRQRLPLGERERVRAALLELYAQHPHFRDELKVYARKQSGRAAQPKDSRGRDNDPSKLPMIWSAQHRLSRRVANFRKIGGLIDVRARVLLAIRDQLDDIRRTLARTVQALLRWRSEPDRMPRKSYGYYADQFEAQIRVLKAIIIAPDGRRSFVHDVRDLETAVRHLRAGELEAAFAPADRVVRSLQILQVREYLEEMLTVASVAKDRHAALSNRDQASCLATVKEVEPLLNAPDLHDSDFDGRPVLGKMRDGFGQVQQALRDSGADAQPLYDALVTAREAA